MPSACGKRQPSLKTTLRARATTQRRPTAAAGWQTMVRAKMPVASSPDQLKPVRRCHACLAQAAQATQTACRVGAFTWPAALHMDAIFSAIYRCVADCVALLHYPASSNHNPTGQLSSDPLTARIQSPSRPIPQQLLLVFDAAADSSTPLTMLMQVTEACAQNTVGSLLRCQQCPHLLRICNVS